MKAFLKLFCFFLLANQFAYGQNCPYANIDEYNVNRRAFDAYKEALRTIKHFPVLSENGSMGIYLLTQYRNTEGKECWQIETCLDDRYKLFLPKAFSYHDGPDLVLVYDGDLNGNKTIPSQNPKLLQCYEEIVGDRVYLRPPRQERKVELLRL